MRLNLLGPVEVTGPSGVVPLGGTKARALVAQLGLAAGRVVPATRLIESLWGDDPPATAMNTLQYHVSVLRRSLASGGVGDVLRTAPPGYRLDLPTDVEEFDALTQLARRAEPEPAIDLCARALGLWRGPALADLADAPFAEAAAIGLEERRLGCTERWAQAMLDAGRATELVEPLRTIVATQPTRETLWARLITALYRSGRQADALAAFADVRKVLDDLIGVEPGPELQALQRAVLVQDPALRGAAPAARPMPTTAAPVVASTFVRSSMVVGGARLEGAGSTPVELGRNRLLIGRSPECAIVVAAGEVSRLHAAIEPVPGGHRIRDLASTNGTRINGTLLTDPAVLRDGDVVAVGPAEWTFRTS